MCICVSQQQRNKKQKVSLTNFSILLILVKSVNGETHNAYNLYNITNIVTLVPRENFTKETNSYWSIEQRKNCSAEKTLGTVYYQSKDFHENLKTED